MWGNRLANFFIELFSESITFLNAKDPHNPNNNILTLNYILTDWSEKDNKYHDKLIAIKFDEMMANIGLEFQ